MLTGPHVLKPLDPGPDATHYIDPPNDSIRAVETSDGGAYALYRPSWRVIIALLFGANLWAGVERSGKMSLIVMQGRP